jgi:flagellin
MLTRLKELSTQAASANAGANLDKINAEGNKLIEEIDRIAASTEYAGSKLLNGSFGVSVATSGTAITAGTTGFLGATGLQSGVSYTVAVSAGGGTMTISATLAAGQVSQTVDYAAPTSGTKEVRFSALGLSLKVDSTFVAAAGTLDADAATPSLFQVGAKNTANDQIGITLGSATTIDLGLTSDQLLNAVDSQTFMGTVDDAIATLNGVRGDIGAAQNRLTYAAANLSITIENVQAAESVIRDVDMAAEMTTFTKNQILLQAGTAMLAQANLAPQAVLSLFG